jgi:hypothetical protein
MVATTASTFNVNKKTEKSETKKSEKERKKTTKIKYKGNVIPKTHFIDVISTL